MLRIIAGQWRGRRWRFVEAADLRPTPDRVRETLFNWLSPFIVDARCLDLFAGSGALGLEALSRGAAHVTFVEREKRAAQAIGELLRDWMGGAEALNRSEVIAGDSLQYLARAPKPFTCVFLDPPFASSLADAAIVRLSRGWLAPGALVYLERPAAAPLADLPHGWAVRRTKQAGEVGYHLLEFSAAGAGLE